MIRLLAALLIWLAGTGLAAADRLDLIQRRGAIIVGVKADYVPFGMLDKEGRLVGIEADLAADLARRLGVELRLVAVTSVNRLQKVEQGSVDLIIATLGDTPERRAIATIVEPGYFASGANIMLRPDAAGLEGWADLKGKKVCATQGALFNGPTARRFLVDLEIYGGNREAKLALRAGRCVGWLYDDVALINQMAEPDWADYRMPLPTAVPTPWAMALARGEAGGRLERLVGDAAADWHRTGLAIETFRRWGLDRLDYLERMRAQWTATTPDGQLVCRREADGAWPLACREESVLTSGDVTGLHRLVLSLRDSTGIYLSFLHDGYEQRLLGAGLVLTIALSALSIAGGLGVGLLGASLLAARVPLVPRLASAFAAVCRMTPPLLQLYLVFFGVGYWLSATVGVRLDAFLVAVLCFSLYAGAANATAIAEARASFPAGPMPWRAALARAWTPVMSSSVNIAKATGMASAIAVPELVYASTSVVTDNGNPGVMMHLLMLLYFLVVLAFVHLFELAGRRWAPS